MIGLLRCFFIKEITSIKLIISDFNLSPLQMFYVFFAAACAGANKAGIHGISLIAIPLLSSVLGVKQATGCVLLIFISCDCLAVLHYRKVNLRLLLRFLPLSLLGLFLAALIGKQLNEHGFKIMITILLSFILILLILPSRYKTFLKTNKIVGNFFGFLGGFTSMAGNIGGPIMVTYLLAQNISKTLYLGVYSYFFFSINFIKLFIMTFYWKTINWKIFKVFLTTVPFLFLGFIIGSIVVKHVQKEKFYVLITGLTICSCLYLFYTMFSL